MTRSAARCPNRRSARIGDARHHAVALGGVGAEIEQQSFSAPEIKDDRRHVSGDTDLPPGGEIGDPAAAPARLVDRNVRLALLMCANERGGVRPLSFGAEPVARTKTKSSDDRDRSGDVGLGQRDVAAVVMLEAAAFAGAAYSDAGVKSADTELAREI